MTLEDQLAEAETAYHRLITGQQAKVVVDQNGERVEFLATSAWRLASYIADLKRQLGLVTPGPARTYF